MTDTDCLDEHATGLIIPSWVIIGKKADLSSEYEDLSSEEKIIIYGHHLPWWIFPQY